MSSKRSEAARYLLNSAGGHFGGYRRINDARLFNVRELTGKTTFDECTKLMKKLAKSERRLIRAREAGNRDLIITITKAIRDLERKLVETGQAYYDGRVWRHRRTGGVYHNRI